MVLLWNSVFLITFFLQKSTPGTNAGNASILSLYQTFCRNTCNDTNETQTSSDQELDKNSSCNPCTPCSCEDTCQMFGTCCPDFKNQTPIFHTQCMIISFKLPSTNILKIKSHVITGCPMTTSSTHKEACRTGILEDNHDPRLAMITETGLDLLFNNSYCAMCNGHNTSVVLQPELHCRSRLKLPSFASAKDLFLWAESDSRCDIVYSSPLETLNLPTCSDASDILTSVCNSTGLWESYEPELEEACHQYYNPLVKEFTPRYRNIFCYLCNGEDSSRIVEHHCLSSVFKTHETFSFKTTSFVAILNFLPALFSSQPAPQDMSPACGKSTVYDPLEKTCKPLVCPDYEVLVDGRCQLQFFLLQDVSFHINVLFLPNTTVRSSSDRIPDMNFQIFTILDSHLSLKLKQVNMTLDAITTTLRPVNQRPDGYLEVESVFLDFYAKPVDMINVDDAEKLLLNSELYQLELEFVDSMINFSYTVIYGGEEVDVSHGQYPSAWEVSRNAESAGSEFYLQINPASRCPLVEYEEISFKILSNWQIQHQNTNVRFNRTVYMVKGFKILLCSWHLETIPSADAPNLDYKKTASSQTGIQNLSGSATATSVVQLIGLVCLFLTFLTYSIFSELRTLPGKNLMFLVLSLFVAHLTFMTGAHAVSKPKACAILGIIIHFSWLSSFAWMAVCSFHVYKIFKTVRPSVQTQADPNCLYRYSAFAFGVPFLIVLLVCVVNLGMSNGKHIGYSSDENSVVCFITSVLASVLTFGLPITINIFHNVLFLVSVCVSLRKASRLRRSLQQKDLSILSHCCKLSTLTGVSWVFGFVTLLTQSNVFAYLFVLLSAGQGVFIFFAFVTTKRVFKLYRNLLKRKCQREKNSGNRERHRMGVNALSWHEL